jgi:DNA-binding beta-propeller fold protein YncE
MALPGDDRALPESGRLGGEIEFTAPPGVTALIAALGRTEDVRFSPDNRRLAIAGFARDRIAVFDIDIATTAAGTHVALTGAVALSSPSLKNPHGLDFIDDYTLIVANRTGDVAMFGVPVGRTEPRSYGVDPIQTWRTGGDTLLDSPGSVAVVGGVGNHREIVICNNTGNTVTRHLLATDAEYVAVSSDVLLRKWLDIPDGVAVSPDGRWMAVSNHETHCVLLYERGPSLNEHSDPDGILHRVHYPHGLRFSADGRHLFVADAGAPYVYVYANGGVGWHGVRQPAATLRVIGEPLYLRGRHNPEEGGPKGIDVDAGSRVLVVTSEFQPLAFFDLPAMVDAPNVQSEREQCALEVSVELCLIEHTQRLKGRIRDAELRLAIMQNSASWRLTAPLRRLHWKGTNP